MPKRTAGVPSYRQISRRALKLAEALGVDARGRIVIEDALIDFSNAMLAERTD